MKPPLRSGVNAVLTGLVFAVVQGELAFADPPKFKATIIEVPEGFLFGFGAGINNAGQVVGNYRTHVDFSRVFLYSDGTVQDLGALGGRSTTASDINDSGQITGEIRSLAGGIHAFLYSNGVVEELGDPDDRSVGFALNDAGDVTGMIDFPNGQAFLYSGGVMQRLPQPESFCSNGFFQGLSINNLGQVTGPAFVQTPAGCSQQAVVYSDGRTTVIDLPLESRGQYISDSGQVSIDATGPEGTIGYLYANGQLEEIGPVSPGAINKFGWMIAGAGMDEQGAFLYIDGELFDLADLVTNFREWDHFRGVADINDSGQITGTGITADGDLRAYLLTPLALKVSIDIKPGSKKNPVNLRSNGNIAVAVLSTGHFDATQVNWETVAFGPREASEVHQRAHVQDIDEDGDMDLLLHFRIRETGIRCSDTTAMLTGRTFDGQSFTGFGPITVVKCR